MRKTLSTRLAVLFGAGALMAAACGDNIKPGGGDDDDDDDAPIDAEVPDMEPPPVFTGTITVLEASVFGAPILGQGIQIAASFFENGGVPPVYEENAGPTGCKVWEYTPAQVADVGSDEGAVVVTIDNPEAHGFDPAIPGCGFVAGRGYMCPDATQSTGGTVQGLPDAANPGSCVAGRLMLIDTDAPFTFHVTDGRYVVFSGTGTPLLPDGTTLPVIGKLPVVPPAPEDNTTVILPYPAATATCIPATPLDAAAVHLTLGGVGPVPGFDNGGSTAPGFLANDATVTVALTAGGGSHIPSFTATFPGDTHSPGDDFVLDAASSAIFAPPGSGPGAVGIPLDGNAFTVACDNSKGAGCAAGPPATGDGVVLNIVTTDADLTGVGATTLPPPMTKRVQVRCAALGSNSVTVNATASAHLMTSGATKLQATFIRGSLSGNPEGTVNIVAGHAITTFQVVPPPAKRK
jgi:hypothetical protein